MESLYNFPDIKTRTTFDGLDIELIVNDEPVVLTDCSIVMNISANKGASVCKSLSIGSGITVTDAEDGKFSINPFLVDLVPGLYNYEIEIKRLDGYTKVRMEGKWNILPRLNLK